MPGGVFAGTNVVLASMSHALLSQRGDWDNRTPFSKKGLVTNYGDGGLQNGRGACKVLPLRKGGRKKCLSHAEGGRKKFPLFKRGGAKSFTLS